MTCAPQGDRTLDLFHSDVKDAYSGWLRSQGQPRVPLSASPPPPAACASHEISRLVGQRLFTGGETSFEAKDWDAFDDTSSDVT